MNLEQTLRECAPAVVGALARRFGDFADAEDATQEALIAAAAHWPADGIPDNPRAWLIRTGARRLLNQWRSDQARRHREALAAQEPPPAAVSDVDDTLTVLFMCCHPVLTDASAIALTLRAVGGLTTAEIAKAFLVPEATMAQRISRAKQRIRGSGQPFQRPGPAESRQRLPAVLHVLYLSFNQVYLTSAGPGDAIRLARLVHGKLPEHGEAAGLLALMLLTDARRPARMTSDGELVPLAEQDRSRWDRALIAEGTAVLDRSFGRGPIGEYQLQAAIAALHDRAQRVEDTDWPQILALYAHARVADRQPGRGAQPGRGRRHGARSRGGAPATRRPRREVVRESPAGGRTRTPAGNGRGPGGRGGAVSGRGGTRNEPARAPLPHDESRPAGHFRVET